MKGRLLLVLMVLVLAACSSKQKKQSAEQAESATSGLNFKLEIDSAFLANYSTDGLSVFPKPEHFAIGDDESVYSLVREKLIFYRYKTFDLKGPECVVLLTGFPDDFEFDGELRFVYLASLGEQGQVLDIKQVGRLEEGSDNSYLVTATIEGNQVLKKLRSQTFYPVEKTENGYETLVIHRSGEIGMPK